MKKQMPEKVLRQFPGFLLHCILAVFLAGAFSCGHAKPQQSTNIAVEKGDSGFARQLNRPKAPIVIPLTTSNQPKVIVAGKPHIKVDSSGIGIPLFTNYGLEQGLASNSITCSIEDNLGNLWFGTSDDGIYRFDGKNFTEYTTAQGLPGNGINCLFQSRTGDIWIGTRAGLSRYDGKAFTNFTTTEGLAKNVVNTIMQDKAGNIWVGIYLGGASRFDGKKFTNYPLTQRPIGTSVNTIIQESRTGDLWFGTTRDGIIRYDGKKIILCDTALGLTDAFIQCFMRDSKGSIWFVTVKGIYKYAQGIFTNYTEALGWPDFEPTAIEEDREGSIWITGGNGVTRYDGHHIESFTKADGLPGNPVNSLTIDKHGSIWLGIANGEISRYNGRQITYYSPSKAGVTSFGAGSLKDNAGNLWFSTGDTGVIRYDGKSFAHYTTAEGLGSNTVFNITQDKKGNIWFATDNGACCYNGKTFTTYSVSTGVAGTMVRQIAEDNEGNIWMVSWGRGISRFDGKSFTNYSTDQGLPSNLDGAVLTDHSGNMWFGTYGGVSGFDGKTFTNYSTAQGLPSNVLTCLWMDKSGQLWVGTDAGGVSRFNGKRFVSDTAVEDLVGNSIVYGLAEDLIRKKLWFATSRGLSWINTDTSFSTKNLANHSGTYDQSNGLPVRNINRILIDDKGIMWAVGTEDKLTRLDDHAMVKDTLPFTLQIKNIRVNGENMCWNNLDPGISEGHQASAAALQNEMVTTFGKKLSGITLDSLREKYKGIRFDSLSRFYPVPANLVLPYADRNLTFDFLAIAPDKASNIKYQYKLEGYDKGWSDIGGGSTAVFGNIPEGQYTFKLKAMSPEGVWSSLDYRFTVLPPWYRTWWAWLLYIVLAGAAIWLFVYLRSLRLLEQKHRLENTVKQRTEEVLYQKKEIELQRDGLEKAFQDLKTTQNQLIQAEKMASLGELTAGIAHEIQNPLNFVNNFSEVSIEMMDELDEELAKGDMEEVKFITTDIKQNLKKINQHGKRADAIVKGMLQHSRKSGGAKEPVDLNQLIDEYLKLTYHGLRAKDAHLEVELISDFDRDLPKINLIPQDIGRVLLNLFSNAFYAVKQKQINAAAGYKPTVKVKTALREGFADITITDNGTGIPDAIKDKIMQPFFTTRPTGEGTGLGLSLSYDIVVKGHSGAIKVNSAEGEGSAFLISLPV